MTLFAGARAEIDEIPVETTDQERMQVLIDTLGAYIEYYHGGALELVSFNGDKLVVRMAGACQGCNLQEVTLHGWIEETVRPFFPDLKEVVAVD